MAVTHRLITLLIVDDSAVQRELLFHVLGTRPNFKVIGFAKNGIEALEALKVLKPNVILMDLHMPKMNGIEAIQHIMSIYPVPIIAMSATPNLDKMINGFKALEAGAIAFVEKPASTSDPRFDALISCLLKTVKLMAEIKVVRRHYTKPTAISVSQSLAEDLNTNEIELIVVGASTGGPIVLRTILSALPPDFPPILIVQHIIPGFIQGLAAWLMQSAPCPILIAKDNQILKRGHVYLAPDHHHTGVRSSKQVLLKPKINTSAYELCPSVDFLFSTVAEVFRNKAMGILLTGMGSDGVTELKNMRKQGAVTIAQDKKSSLIYGMPGQAATQGAAAYILTPEQIATTIASLARG